jgi:hypothetical protein
MRVAVARGLAHTAAAMPADNLPTDELLMERYRDGDAGARERSLARRDSR